MKTETHLDSVLRRLTQWSLFVAVGISALSFIGWALGSTFIISLSPHYIPIAPSTAFCFFILGASFLGYVLHPENLKARTVAGLCASFVILICSVILIASFQGITFEAEHLGFYLPAILTRLHVGHMSPITATDFVAASLGVLCLIFSPKGGQFYKNAAAFLALALVATALTVILGYLYGTPLLYGGSIIPVAFPTAVAFAFLGLGLLTASGPHVLPVRVFAGPSVRSRLIRAFLPTIIAFVLIYGWVYKTVLPMTRNPALISSLITILSAAFIGIIISKIAHSIGAEIDLAHRERDKQDEALRESEEKFRSLAEQSIVGISIIQDGVLKYVNPKLADIFGYTVDECLDNMPYHKVVFPDDHNIVTERIKRRIAGEYLPIIYEFRGVTKNGKVIDVEVYGAPILYDKKPAVVSTVLDVSHRKFIEMERNRQGEALRESEEKFRSLAMQSIVGIAIIQDGILKYVNPKFADMFGYTVDECLGNMPYHKVVFPDDHKIVTDRVEKRIARESTETVYELRGVKKNGEIINIEIYGAPILYNNKPAAVATILDISRRKFMEMELKALSITDTLTGLYNRRGFIALSEQQFKQTERKKDGLTLLFADLDNLKQINDSLGHTAGDKAIVEAAEVFKEVFRKMDIIGRVGGDEFAILAPETSREYSNIINNRLQEQLDIHNARKGRNYTISISVGTAYRDPKKPCSLDELMSLADSLMYKQKKAKHL